MFALASRYRQVAGEMIQNGEVFFRDCLQGRAADPKPLTKKIFWVLKTSASAAFGENFRLLTPFLEILEPMESPFKELSNAPLISS